VKRSAFRISSGKVTRGCLEVRRYLREPQEMSCLLSGADGRARFGYDGSGPLMSPDERRAYQALLISKINRSGFIYFISRSDNPDRVKVGWTKGDVWDRKT
jgi:hypothetical protein